MANYDLTVTVLGRDAASSTFERVAASFGRIGEIASGILIARTLEKIAVGIFQIGVAAIDAASKYQFLQTGLIGLVGRELVSLREGVDAVGEVFEEATVKAGLLMEELARIAILSPYTLEAVHQVYKLTLAFGWSTEQANLLTKALLEMAAGIGADSSMLQRMAYNLSQLKLENKITALSVRQLALAGFDLNSVIRYIGEEMGLTIETHKDWNALLEEGKVTWQDFATHFAVYAEKNFSGAAERMARTMYGLKSTLHDIWILTVPKVVLPAVDAFTSTMSDLLDVFLRVRQAGFLEVWGENLRAAFVKVLEPASTLLQFFTEYFDVQDRLKRFSVAPVGGLAGLIAIDELADAQQAFDDMALSGDLVADALNHAFGPESLKLLEKFRRAVEFLQKVWNFLVGVIKEIYSGFAILFGRLADFWDDWGDQITASVMKVVSALGLLGGEAIGGGLSMFSNAMQILGDWIVAHGGSIAYFIAQFADWIVERLIPAIRSSIEWISDKLPKAWTFLLDIWDTKVIPGLKTLVGWFEDKVIPAFDKVIERLDEELGPAFDDFGAFLKEHEEDFKKFGDALVSIALSVGTIAAFTSGFSIFAGVVFKLGQAAIGIKFMGEIFAAIPGLVGELGLSVGGLATFGAILVAIAAAIAGLYFAVKTNFGGTRDFIVEAWGIISDTFSDVNEKFGIDWPEVLAAAAAAIVGAFKAALAWLADFLENVLYPAIILSLEAWSEFADWASDVSKAVADDLGPKMKTFFDWWAEHMTPAIVAAGEAMASLNELGLTVVKLGLELLLVPLNTLIDALIILFGWLNDNVSPAFSDAYDWLESLGTKSGDVTTLMDSLGGALDTVTGWLRSLAGWAQTASYWLSQLRIPGSLIQYSPSPMERAIAAVADKLQEATMGAKGLGRELKNITAPNLRNLVPREMQAFGQMQTVLANGNIPGRDGVGQTPNGATQQYHIEIPVTATINNDADIDTMARRIATQIKYRTER